MSLSEHYFTEKPSSSTDRQRIRVSVRGVEREFWTDSSVFSKRGLDFGTRLLLDKVSLPAEAQAVDLGCGYGPIVAILASVYPNSQWIAVDINERALALAEENCVGLTRVKFVQSDGLTKLQGYRFTDVLTNPPIRAGKPVVYRFFRESREVLLPGGRLWVVMAKKQGAESAAEFLRTLFSKVERVARDGGYHLLCAEVKG
jgi:16S rRNA (guanine1207-N2)-methyltransferase